MDEQFETESNAGSSSSFSN